MAQVKVSVLTMEGSLAGEETLQMAVGNDLTVGEFKILVQSKDAVPPEERDNPGQMTRDGVSPDFQHLFLNGEELGNDECALKDAGVGDGTELAFGVGPTVAKRLRAAVRGLSDDPVNLNHVSDDKILGAVLKNLENRVKVAGPGSTQLIDKLYKIFKPKFRFMDGVVDGCLHFDEERGHVVWSVDETEEGAYPFKTCYGITVSTQMYRRKKQSGSIQGLGNPTSLIGTNGETGSQGYFASLQRMACVAHFGGNTGTQIYPTAHDFSNNANALGQTTYTDNNGVDYAIATLNRQVEESVPIVAPPPVGSAAVRPATFQTAALQATVSRVFETKVLVTDP